MSKKRTSVKQSPALPAGHLEPVNPPTQPQDKPYVVGRGRPPKEYQFKPGQSGNPKGQPKHRTHLWTHFCKYMNMTEDERSRIHRSRLTASEQAALQMAERAAKGRGCGFQHLMQYIVDREEGKAAEHIVISDQETLTDEQCDEIREGFLMIIQQRMTHASKDRR